MIKHLENERGYRVEEASAGIYTVSEARGRAEGEDRKALAIAQNMVKMGLPAEVIVSATQLEPEKVKALYQQ